MKIVIDKALALMLTVVVLAGASASSQAASVSLLALPATLSTVSSGDVFEVAVVLDAVDAAGNHPGNFSGAIALGFDATALALNSVTPAQANTLSTPAIGSGSVSFIFGDLQLPGDMGVIATLEFTALAFAGSTGITVADANALGSFVNELNAFTPSFDGIDIAAAVPVPAAAWLFLSALGSLTLMRQGTRSA